MSRFRILPAAILVLTLGTTLADAANISTGEPCDIGVFDVSTRNEIFRQWFVPPTVMLLVSAVSGFMAFQWMKKQTEPDRRRMWGACAGVSLAVLATSFAVAGLILFVDQFKPEWLY